MKSAGERGRETETEGGTEKTAATMTHETGKDAQRTYKGIGIDAAGGWAARIRGKGPLGAGSGNLGDTTELAETIAGSVKE